MSLHLPLGPMCVLGAHFTSLSQPSLPACRASKLAKAERLGPSQFFPENAYSPRHVHNPTHAYGLSDSQQYVRAFQSPLWTFYSQDFAFKLFGVLCTSPGIAILGSHDVKQLSMIVFNKFLWAKI